jgi:hypothetical protein
MFRGHWGKLVAVVGIALLAGLLSVSYSLYNSAQQQHSSYGYQPASKPGFRLDSVTKAPTQHYKPSCQNPNSREDADLCAQWAAVDQVAEANRISSVNVRLAILTLLVTVFGTGLLLWTFDETRETSRRELRAYVHLKSADLHRCKDKGFPTDSGHPEQRYATIDFHNYGSTPAHKVIAAMGTWIGPVPLKAPLSAIPENLERAVADLPPGRSSPMPLEVINSGNMHDTILQGGWGVYFWGEITYEDIFGRKHTTHIRLVSEGSAYKLGSFRVMATGNDAD